MPESHQHSQGKTALITGASSGIGYELARLFAADAYDLVLIARGKEALLYAAGTLRETYGVSVIVQPTDLSQPTAPQEVVSALQRQDIHIDALVNNAGFGLCGSFTQTDVTTELEMIQVHIVTLTHLTKLLLPDLLKSRAGKILNVASLAAFQPGPLMAVYYATKAYVLSFSEALANELRETGVVVTALCPGPTRTAFHQRAGLASSRLFTGKAMDAIAVARIGYRGLLRRQTVVIPGLQNRLLAFAVKLTPRDIVTQVVRKIQEGREPR